MVELSRVWTLIVDVAVWGAWSTACGVLAWRLPVARLQDAWLYRLRPAEVGGRWYERRLGIRSWKDRLPEAGALFPGGLTKRQLPSRDRAGLERFVVETRRAELTHWLVMAIAPLFFLWNPVWAGFVMIAYAVVANVPCIAVQRYNRARLERMLRSRRH